MSVGLKKDYLEKFWVGLIDGDGSLQVNHWNRKYLQFRAVIKLKNTSENENILHQLASVTRGFVRKDLKQGFVIWVSDHQTNLNYLLKIFERYPPLTQRIRCQLRFFKDCIIHKNVDQYLKERSFKYNYSFLINLKPLPDYFSQWLSGFIEAKGCFCVRKNGVRSFSISQKNESTLLMTILKYFQTSHITIQIKKAQFYIVEFSNKQNLDLVHQHLLTNPLLGAKLQSYRQIFPKISNIHPPKE